VEQTAAHVASSVELQVVDEVVSMAASEELLKSCCGPLQSELLIKALLISTAERSLLAMNMHAAVADTRWGLTYTDLHRALPWPKLVYGTMPACAWGSPNYPKTSMAQCHAGVVYHGACISCSQLFCIGASWPL
jgi:hypothetical protein